MTFAGSEDVKPEPPVEGVQAPRTYRRWPWYLLLTVLVAALLGTALGVGVVLRGRSFGAAVPLDTESRPTFVIAAPPRPSPSPSTLPQAAAQVPSTASSSDVYTVEAGDTLRSIAQAVYDDPTQWPRIYAANRDTIGPDPDALNAGTPLSIPRP